MKPCLSSHTVVVHHFTSEPIFKTYSGVMIKILDWFQINCGINLEV